MMKIKAIFTMIFLAASCAVMAEGLAAEKIPPAKKYPIQTPDPPAPTANSLRFSILDQGINQLSRPLMFRAEYRHLLNTPEDLKQGFVLDGTFHHLFGTHPALLERFVQPQGYPSFTELNAGVGYRFSPLENVGIIPQVHFRHMFALSPGISHHLTGFEPGLRLEYWIYPEVTKISVDYGFNVPFLHLANTQSNISPFTLSLNRLYTEMSYRLLPGFDILAGFYWWQAPAQLGSGAIVDRRLSDITGFQLGAGLAY